MQKNKQKKALLKKRREKEQKPLYTSEEEVEELDPLEYSPLDIRDENGDPMDLYTFFTSTKR